MTVPDLTGLLFPTDLRLAWDGSATLAHDPDARLLPYLQVPLAPLLLPQPAPGTELEAWRRLHLSLDLDELLGDVAECGHVVLTQCLAPCPPPDCSPPTCLHQAKFRGPAARERGDLAHGSGWRGFNTSQPYLPGGAVAGAGGPGSSSSSPPLGQVGGAEGGEWLQQLLSG
ncbi:hypothetical protein V8C86DRAFT_3025461, partial [Haematococcus lacustris]